MWIYHICFILSSVDGNLGCFYFGAIMNNVAMNVHIQGFVWLYVFIPLCWNENYPPRGIIAGS